MMISFLICPWKPASEWESCDKAAASSRRSICFWERRNADLRESDKREKEIKAREILSLVICMMRIKAFKGEKSSGRRIGKGGRGWSRMGGSRAVVGIFVQGDERVIRSPQCFVFLLAIPWSSSHGKKGFSHCWVMFEQVNYTGMPSWYPWFSLHPSWIQISSFIFIALNPSPLPHLWDNLFWRNLHRWNY